MNTISKVLFILSLFTLSFSISAQTTEPSEMDMDKAKKEMSEGFEQIFEMMDSSTMNNLFNQMDIQKMMGDLNLEEMLGDLNLQEMMGEMKIDTMMQNFDMDGIMGQLNFDSEEMQEMMKLGMDMMKDMDMSEIQKMMEAFGGQMQDLNLDEKLQELSKDSKDKDRKKI